MARVLDKVGDFTIASTDSDSGSYTHSWLGQGNYMGIFVDAAIQGICSLQASPDEGFSWYTVTNPDGTAVALPAGAMVILQPVASKTFRIHSTAAEFSDRVFSIWCIQDI